MKIRDILREIGRERGLTVREEDGSLLGMISDFPVLVRWGPYGRVRAVLLTVRTGPGDFTALKKAVKTAKKMKSSMLKDAGGGSLLYAVPYSLLFMRSTKGAVIRALDSLMPLIAGAFTPPPKACEVCNKPGITNVVEEGGKPALICPVCQATIRIKKEAARKAYEATSPDYLKGMVLGLIGAAAGAAAWALMIVLLKSTYLILTAGIGILVAYFVKRGMGRVDRAGHVIAGVLVLASIFAGEVLAYIWFIGRATGRLNVSMAYHAYMNILLNNPRTLVLTAVFAVAGVWIGILTLSRMEKDTKVETIR